MLLREKKKITANKFIYYDFFLLLSSLLPFLLLLLLLFHWCVGCNFVFIQRIAGTKYPPSTFIILFESSIILYNVRISVQQQCKMSVCITYVRARGHTHSSFNMPLPLFFISRSGKSALCLGCWWAQFVWWVRSFVAIHMLVHIFEHARTFYVTLVKKYRHRIKSLHITWVHS